MEDHREVQAAHVVVGAREFGPAKHQLGIGANDIGLGGDSFVPQPVSFAQLYEGADSFTTRWRVVQSLFYYAPGTTADTYCTDTYTQMPLRSRSWRSWPPP